LAQEVPCSVRAPATVWAESGGRHSVSNHVPNIGSTTSDAGGGDALGENVAAIRRWEQALQDARSPVERLSDRITTWAASGPVLLLHVVWFAAWSAVNTGTVPGVAPFDPFPFPFLTMAVSLEAIFLALFVLASQNRLARQADMRAHLDLQIDLLAEREMTAVLRLLQDVAAHLNAPTTVTASQIRDLGKTTDLDVLTRRMAALVPPTAGADHQESPEASRPAP
jgi:uncharacterized membrane protein